MLVFPRPREPATARHFHTRFIVDSVVRSMHHHNAAPCIFSTIATITTTTSTAIRHDCLHRRLRFSGTSLHGG